MRIAFRLAVVFLLLHCSVAALAQPCNNWMYIPTQPGFMSVGDLDMPGDQITVEALFVRTAPYSHILYAGDLVSKHTQSTDVNYLLRPSTAEITTTNGYYITSEICQIQLNRIYHVAMVYNGSSLKLYRDGELISQVAATGALVQNNWDTRIGFYQAQVYPENLIGYVNEVRIWNTARTQEQIKTNMLTTLPDPPTQQGLVAYYTFDNLLNKQGNAAWNGTLSGSASISNTVPDCSFTPDVCPTLVDTTIVNKYTPVTTFDACANILDVKDASEFKAGDTVLLIQMKGAMIDSSNTASFGNVTDLRNAGNYEYNYVKSVAGNKVELLNSLVRNYDFDDGLVQLIRVPYFQNYETAAVLSCLPWDGEKGGVLVFNVANTLTLNQNIDVSGRGFRGGISVTHPTIVCNTVGYYFTNLNGMLAARKGEGIFNTSTLIVGRGKLVNGGGGGNSTNAGGAGGGNGGSGGKGGDQYIGCVGPNFVNGGVAGANLPYSNSANKIFLGGGGGAGQQNDNPVIGGGGNGGGIAIINCVNLITNGFEIKSEGVTTPHLRGSNDDGRAGGGAGGTVLLDYGNVAGGIKVSVKGGNGDYATPPQLDRHGPGGGGGGGVFWVNKPAIAPGITVDAAGGVNGVNTNINNDPMGAAPGNAGLTLTGLVLPIATTAFEKNIDSVRVNVAPVSCSTFDFEGLAYIKTRPITSWLWHFGDGATASTQNTSHTYNATGTFTVKLVITDDYGCKDSISTTVDAENNNFNFTYTRDICDPFAVNFTGTGVSANAYWDLGDGTIITGTTAVSHIFPEGDYEVKYIVGNNPVCFDTLRSNISVRLLREDIILTPDTTICAGSAKLLRSVFANQYCWTPVGYLDNPSIQNPTTSAPDPVRYYLTAEVPGNNIIVNGDFSQGNTGFNSDYQFNATSGIAEGVYNVGNNVPAWHAGLAACADHTTSNGNMLMVNGSAAVNAVVWSQTLTVQPNTNYVFSAWLQSLAAQNPARLQFTINGRVMGAGLDASAINCNWQRFFAHWNPGSQTTATIAIINQNTGVMGNDFALDDISFAPVLIKRDSVNIDISEPQVIAQQPNLVCVNTSVQLSASGADSYSWNNSQWLDNASVANPIATVSEPTEFVVTGTNAFGCEAKDTIVVNTFPVPPIAVQADTSICRSSSVQLWVTGGQTYSWSPAQYLNSAFTATPVATPVTDTRYFVEITDINNCLYLDSVMISIRPDAVFRATGASRICEGDTLQLSASGGDVYSWMPATDINDPASSTPSVWPSSNTQYSVSIIDTTCFQSATLVVPVTVAPVPDIIATRSNDIDCTVNESILTASGGVQYSWSPAQTLDNASVRSPRARPTVTTTYIVSGKSAQGCTGIDSVTVKVEKVNEGDYLMPSAFSPNNDGLNDCYGVKYWGIVDRIEFSVFNRWGERVFYSKDPNACWDGTHRGIKQDAGVFVYMIKASTNCAAEVFRKGTFVLVR